MRIATYTRISTDEQHQPYSLDAQTDRLAAYVKSQPGWENTRRFSDQMSGAVLERPGLQRALSEAKASRYDLLLVYRVDRLARSVKGLAQILEELDRYGVAFRSATEPFDTATPGGRMFVQMLGVFAEFERATIIDRVVAGMERKAATGAWPGGYRPFGYIPSPGTGFLTIKEDEAALVPTIFDLYVNKRLGSRAIATRLNGHGYRTKSGKPWGHTAILTVLTNRVYIGEIFFRDHYHPAPHAPLVDKGLFDTAQAILEERGENLSLRRSNASEYLLTGLVLCDRCGKRFVGAAAKGNKYRYPYYVCFSRQRYGSDTCSQDRLRAEQLEASLVESLLSTLDQRDLIEASVEGAVKALKANRPSRERELATLDAQIGKAEAALDRYFNAFEKGTLSETTCAARVEKVSSELIGLKSRKEDLVLEAEAEELDTLTADDLREIQECVELAMREAPLAERKALLQTLVAEIRVKDRTSITPVFRVPVFRPPYGLVVGRGFEPL